MDAAKEADHGRDLSNPSTQEGVTDFVWLRVPGISPDGDSRRRSERMDETKRPGP